jgi:hypothetical protein
MGWVVSVTPRPRFSPGERTPGTHCTGGWVGPRSGLDTKAKRNILSPLLEIEPQSPGRSARSQALYWLSYQAHMLWLHQQFNKETTAQPAKGAWTTEYCYSVDSAFHSRMRQEAHEVTRACNMSARMVIMCWTSWQLGLLWDRRLKDQHVHLTDDSWSGMEIARFCCVLMQDGNILPPGTTLRDALYIAVPP